jgi:hypothetical protein
MFLQTNGEQILEKYQVVKSNERSIQIRNAAIRQLNRDNDEASCNLLEGN